MSVFTVNSNQIPAPIAMTIPKISALFGLILPEGTGREVVRVINLSISLSIYMFTDPAPPAAKIPPTRVAKIKFIFGSDPGFEASIMAGTVVIRRSKIIDGLINIK